MGFNDQDLDKDNSRSLSTYTNIIGLPPQLHYSLEVDDKDVIRKLGHMPLCRIIPAYPSSELGITSGEGGRQALHLYGADHSRGIQKWKETLSSIEEKTGLQLHAENLRELYVAYLNETSISESFNNEYAASSFEELANVGSSKVRELRMMTGADTAGQALGELGSSMMGGVLGTVAGVGAKIVGAGVGGVESYLEGKNLGKLLAGSKVDFPQIWQNSSYQSSYSITTRLCNPDRLNEEGYKKLVVAPLIKLLSLATPIIDTKNGGADAEATYSQPLLCSVECSGLWQIRIGYIANIEVIKGSDQNDLNFWMRPNTIDVRITFGELYNVMTNDHSDKQKSTLVTYTKNLLRRTLLEQEDQSGGTQRAAPNQVIRLQVKATIPTSAQQQLDSSIDPLREQTSNFQQEVVQTSIQNMEESTRLITNDLEQIQVTTISPGVESFQTTTSEIYTTNMNRNALSTFNIPNNQLDSLLLINEYSNGNFNLEHANTDQHSEYF